MTDENYIEWIHENDIPTYAKGKDENGYFVQVLETIHTDGTPNEYKKTYYTPC